MIIDWKMYFLITFRFFVGTWKSIINYFWSNFIPKEIITTINIKSAPLIESEMYISFLYKKMIQDGQKIGSFSVIKNPIVLGTPEEYFYELSLL